MFISEVLVFLLGACVGSFLNVCIYRMPRQESVVFKPSHCPECLEKLKFWELVPVISFLILRGKCRSCGARIALQYPLVEAITAVLFYLSYKNWYFSWQGMTMALFFALLVTAAFIDVNHQIIPDKLLFLGVITGLPLAWRLFLLVTGQKGRKDAVPFGPYLALGSVISAFEGCKIIEWYLGKVY